MAESWDRGRSNDQYGYVAAVAKESNPRNKDWPLKKEDEDEKRPRRARRESWEDDVSSYYNGSSAASSLRRSVRRKPRSSAPKRVDSWESSRSLARKTETWAPAHRILRPSRRTTTTSEENERNWENQSRIDENERAWEREAKLEEEERKGAKSRKQRENDENWEKEASSHHFDFRAVQRNNDPPKVPVKDERYRFGSPLPTVRNYNLQKGPSSSERRNSWTSNAETRFDTPKQPSENGNITKSQDFEDIPRALRIGSPEQRKNQVVAQYSSSIDRAVSPEYDNRTVDQYSSSRDRGVSPERNIEVTKQYATDRAVGPDVADDYRQVDKPSLRQVVNLRGGGDPSVDENDVSRNTSSASNNSAARDLATSPSAARLLFAFRPQRTGSTSPPLNNAPNSPLSTTQVGSGLNSLANSVDGTSQFIASSDGNSQLSVVKIIRYHDKDIQCNFDEPPPKKKGKGRPDDGSLPTGSRLAILLICACMAIFLQALVSQTLRCREFELMVSGYNYHFHCHSSDHSRVPLSRASRLVRCPSYYITSEY